nr:DUF4160 domain-containing protein [Maribellus maritimus]
MKIIERDNFKIYIYVDDHYPPHCHVRWSDEVESIIALPTLDLLYGKRITKKLKSLLYEELDALIDAWDKYNTYKYKR